MTTIRPIDMTSRIKGLQEERERLTNQLIEIDILIKEIFDIIGLDPELISISTTVENLRHIKQQLEIVQTHLKRNTDEITRERIIGNENTDEIKRIRTVNSIQRQQIEQRLENFYIEQEIKDMMNILL